MRFVPMAIAAASLVLAPAAFPDAMYKWVDEKGVTHFSSEPPPDGKAQKIDVKPAAPSGAKPGEPLRLEDVRKRALELRDERLAKEKREDDVRRKAEEDKARCLRAQDDLEQMRRSRRIYSMNERGERVYVEDKDRAALLEKAQGNVDTYCR
jgi:hypothetical protein